MQTFVCFFSSIIKFIFTLHSYDNYLNVRNSHPIRFIHTTHRDLMIFQWKFQMMIMTWKWFLFILYNDNMDRNQIDKWIWKKNKNKPHKTKGKSIDQVAKITKSQQVTLKPHTHRKRLVFFPNIKNTTLIKIFWFWYCASIQRKTRIRTLTGRNIM